MMTTLRDLFVAGIRDAQALEMRRLSQLRAGIDDVGSYPIIYDKLCEDLQQTSLQLSRLAHCLAACSEEPTPRANEPYLGDTVSTRRIARAAPVDAAISSLALKHLEGGVYRYLLLICEAAGRSDCLTLLEQCLAEEEQMARWISANLERIAAAYLTAHEAVPSFDT